MEQTERDRIDKITETIHYLLKGDAPKEIDISDYPEDEIKQLSEKVNNLIKSLSEVKDFITPLSQGMLDKEIQTKHFLSSPFKQLQSNLRHLTWQTHEITKGDFSQRVDFMGDFSKAFNSMVVALEKARKEIIAINRELDSFVYRASHDLKAPLISIGGLSAVLLSGYRDKLGQEGRNYLESIKDSAEKMEHLIMDLLELSKIGQTVRRFKDTNVSRTIEGAIANLRALLDSSKIKVIIAENLPNIHCDEGRIEQVFTNLISNSIKYMGSAREPKIEIGFKDKEGDFYELYVADNGIGIEKEDQGIIFDIFQRVGETNTEGTGVGLAIVKKIIESHGGTIWVDSEKNKGATFSFTLPKPGFKTKDLGFIEPVSK